MGTLQPILPRRAPAPPPAPEVPARVAPAQISDAPYDPQVPDVPSPGEDVERKPDGVPHQVVGLTALSSVMIAVLVAVIYLTGGIGRYAAVALAVVAVPLMAAALGRKAARDRDHEHPSR